MGDRKDLIKFGPEWLRNLSSERNTDAVNATTRPTTSAAANTNSRHTRTFASGPPPHTTSTAVTIHHSGQAAGGGAAAAGTSSSNHSSSKVQLAKLRYGREEMLALFDTRSARAPAELKHNDVLYLARGKAPFALVTFEDSRQNPRPGGMPAPEFNSGRGVCRTPLSEFSPGRAASRAPLGAGDRTRVRPMNRHGTGRGAGVLEPRPSWNAMNYRSSFPPPTAEDPPGPQRPWNNSASGNRLPGELSEWHNKVFKSKRPGNNTTNWRQAHREEGGDEWRSSDLGRSRSNNNLVEREWGDRNRRTWASGDPRSAHDELPEWFDNPDAGAGTFDASGAFHGASSDDATPPAQAPAALTRSHTHAAFERPEEWWLADKARKLSKACAQTQKRSAAPAQGSMSMSLRRSESHGSLEEIPVKLEKRPGSSNANANASASANSSAMFKPQFERKAFNPLGGTDMEKGGGQAGNFQSVMITSNTNNSLRQKHQNLVPPSEQQKSDEAAVEEMLHFPLERNVATVTSMASTAAGITNARAQSSFAELMNMEGRIPFELAQSLRRNALDTFMHGQDFSNVNDPLFRVITPNIMANSTMNNIAAGDALAGSGTMPTSALAKAALGTSAVGSSAMGSAAMGGSAMGSAAMGSSAMGSAAMGSTSMASVALGNAVMGSTSMGSAAIGNTVMGSTSMGSAAIGNTVMGSTSMGTAAIGNAVMGSPSMGSVAMGNAAMASAAMGSAMPLVGNSVLGNAGLTNAVLGHSISNTGLGGPRMMNPTMNNIAGMANETMPLSGMSQFQNNNSMPGISAGNMSNLDNMQIRGADYHMLRAMEMQGQGSQPAMYQMQGLQHPSTSSAFNALYGNVAHGMQPDLTEQQWYYEDPEKNIQGPFSSAEMYYWFSAGFFNKSMLVRRSCDPEMRPLGSYGPMPFMPSSGDSMQFASLDIMGNPPFGQQPMMDGLWAQPAWMQPRGFWSQRSGIRLPEEIAKEMKTEDEILAQLRADQVSESANSTNRLSPDLGDLNDIIQLVSPSPATPSVDSSNILATGESPQATEGSVTEEKSETTKQVDKPTKNKETNNPTKSKSKKPKEDKREEEVLPEAKGKPDESGQPERQVQVPLTPKAVQKEKTSKKENEKIWTKDTFALVKSSIRDLRKKAEEAKVAEEAERKRKEEERLAADEEKKRKQAEVVRKQQEAQQRELQQRASESAAKRAPWSAPPASASASASASAPQPSLADIQRLEREKKLEQMKEQHHMMALLAQHQAAALARDQEMQASLGWAKKTTAPAVNAPSLADIQAETRRQAATEASAQQAAAQQASAQPQEEAPQANNGGFWESSRGALKGDKAPTKGKKKSIAAGSKEAGAGAAAAAEFEAWCNASLSTWSSNVDVPTFVNFLKDIESPYEVKDYVKCYLGETKEANDFARNFLERRSKLLRVGMETPVDDLCSPAAAVNPRPAAADYQEVRAKGRRGKKNRMLKVDARILGFSVTASEDRINVGDIDMA